MRIRAKNPLIADQVAVNWRKADLSPREYAMLAYAEKVALRAHQIDASDHAALAKAGFSQAEIWDIGAIAAFFAMSNRPASATDMRPNDEFYMLGRT